MKKHRSQKISTIIIIGLLLLWLLVQGGTYWIGHYTGDRDGTISTPLIKWGIFISNIGIMSGLFGLVFSCWVDKQKWRQNVLVKKCIWYLYIGENLLCRRPLMVAFLTNVFIFFLSLACFSPQYQTNDDAVMNMFASGKGIIQQPSEFLLFQHYFIGRTLKSLYLHHPDIPWYGLFLYAYLFISSVTSGYALLRIHPKLNIFGLWVAGVVVFYLITLLSPQFTICAGFLGATGIMLLFSICCKPRHSSKIEQWGGICVSSLLLVLSGMVRFQSLELILCLMLPCSFYLLVKQRNQFFRGFLPVICGTFCIAILLSWWNQHYYAHSRGWVNFFQYNKLLVNFMDRERIIWDKTTEPLFQKIGWSKNDLQMIHSWFYLDSTIYRVDHLAFLAKNIPRIPRSKFHWRGILTELQYTFFSSYGILTLMGFGLLFYQRTYSMRISAISIFLLYCGLFIGISLLEKIPIFRVYLVMLFACWIMSMLFYAVEESNKPANRKKPFMITILVFSLCFAITINEIRRIVKLDYLQTSKFEELKDDMIRLNPHNNQLFVSWANCFPYEFFQLPLSAKPINEQMQTVLLGAGNHEPHVQNRLSAFRISNLYQSFYQRDDIFLVADETRLPLLTSYIQEHYQTDVQGGLYFKGNTFKVYQIKKEQQMYENE